jgi:hypothetical protein
MKRNGVERHTAHMGEREILKWVIEVGCDGLDTTGFKGLEIGTMGSVSSTH